MTLGAYALPFGLRQVKLTPIDNSGALLEDESVLLPASRTFSFSETEEFEDLQGDDRTVASHGAGPIVEWELEGGGISFAVWKILSGASVAESGTTPNTKRTLSKKTSDSRPYFQVEGRAISDNGGDVHGVVYRCKADGDLEAEMANGSFLLTNASGKGYGDELTEKLYDWVHNETPVPLTAGPAPTVTGVAITGASAVATGATINLVATATYSNGSTANVTSSAVWVSSATDKATVASGVVTGVAAGTSNITAAFGSQTSPNHSVTVS